MKKVLCGFALALLGSVMGGGLSTEVNAQAVLPTVPSSPTTLDVVTLKNGSVIYGEVIEMAGGVLQIKTPTSPDNLMKVNWGDVSKLSVNHPIPFHLKEGSVIMGTATAGPNGTLNVQAEPLKGTIEVPMDSVTSMNPVIQPPVIYSGSGVGANSHTTGNSHLNTARWLDDLVDRTTHIRLSITGSAIY